MSRPQTALTAIGIGLGFLVAGNALGDEVRAIEGEAPALPEIRLITAGDRAGVTVPAAADPAREALALMAEKIR